MKQELGNMDNSAVLKKPVIQNHANTNFLIRDLITKRWSARSFSTKPVEKEKLLSILEAARWAPSSHNEQPWRYIVFTKDNPEKLKEAQTVSLESNSFAKRAPILICAITKKTYSHNGHYNRPHFHDLGAANENMFLESFNQGLIMHEMGGFDIQKARALFKIPEDYEIGIMIALGYQDNIDAMPDKYREKAHLPRERKSLSEIAFLEEINKGIV